MDALALRFSRFFIKYRGFNLAIIGGLTLFFLYEGLQLQVFSQFIDLLPRNHPYIQVYEKYNRQFGSANVVAAAIVANEGTIYSEEFLEKVYAFTDQIDKVEGVDHGQITSITAITVRDQEVDREGIMRSRQIIGEQAIALLEAQFFGRRAVQRAQEADPASPPKTLDDLRAYVAKRKGELQTELGPTFGQPLERMADRKEAERLRLLRKENAELEFLALRLAELPQGYELKGEKLVGPEGRLIPKAIMDGLPDRIHQNKQVFGRLVSLDDKAVLIAAGFLEGRLDYKKIFDEIYALKQSLEHDGTAQVHLTGQPVLAGWTFAFLPEIIEILFLSLGVLLVLLAFYFRRFYGVIMPFSGAIVSAIWGLGFTALMGYQLEPLVLVIPMLITARAVSHSVQFVERFYEEYERLNGDKYEAIITSMAELLLPGTLAIITDAFGILVIYVSSIALMKKVALVGAFWAMSIAVTEMLLNRLMIAYFPAPKDTSHYTPKPIVWVLQQLSWMATSPRSVRVILGVWILIVLGSLSVAPFVPVGESHPGTPILWPNSEFNQSAKVISSKFYGADELTIVVETEMQGGIHRPEVMHEIEAFQRYMEQDPKVGGTLAIVDYLKAINRTFHNADPRWSSIPYTPQEIGGLLYLYEAGSPDPRVLNPVRDQVAQNAAVRIFYADHKGDTIREAIARVKYYLEKRPTGTIQARLEVPENDWVATVFWWIGPLLPPRPVHLGVYLQGPDGQYEKQAVARPDRTEPPPPDSKERILTLPRTTRELRETLVAAGYDTVAKIASANIEQLGKVEGFDLATAYALINAAKLDRRNYRVVEEWKSPEHQTDVEVRKRGFWEPDELWIKYQGGDYIRRESGRWAEGTSFALASGLMGVLAASNEEVEGSNNATLIASFVTTFLIVWISYRSAAIALYMILSLGTASVVSLAYMYFARIGFDVNTLPVQALGVGVGVDYALYIMDRVVHERKRGHSIDESVRIAIKTTGMAVFFTASTLVGGIIFWYFISSLRFAADMSLLLSVVLTGNMIGAMLLVPALTVYFKPAFAVEAGKTDA
ncbi:MAG TPA: MMPL family transporter [Myxococcota bacterium]|nr:MMPL family transporter [Myxococcota bacterium]